MVYIGIDPGKGGGIAALRDTGEVVVAVKMPETERDILDALNFGFGKTVFAAIERVSSSPQMGVSSSFTFGKGFGGLLMALASFRYPFDLVTPQTWQKFLSCRTGGDKNVSKLRAQQLFPLEKITHATADALLIAEYCRRIHGAVIKAGGAVTLSTVGRSA